MAAPVILPLAFAAPIEFDPKDDATRGTGVVPKIAQNYELHPTSKTQKRLQGRGELRPTLDLKAYDCVAIIDLIWIVVRADRPICPKNLRIKIKTKTAHVKFVVHNSERTPDYPKGVLFKALINEPTPGKVSDVLTAINSLDGIETDGELEVVEVSVDIYPKERTNENARLMMSDLLQRHIRPKESLWRYDGGWLRQVGATKKPQFVIGNNIPDMGFNKHVGNAERHSCLQVDKTKYFGARDHGPAMIRVMHKTIDDQDRSKGILRVLAAGERRSRTEVELRREALDEIGLNRCDDLWGMDFQKTRVRFFEFCLPTLPLDGAGSLGEAVATAKREMQLRVFQKSGVFGLSYFQHASVKFRNDLRRQKLRDDGVFTPLIRAGVGPAAQCIAFDELNRMFDRGLQKLSRAWRR